MREEQNEKKQVEVHVMGIVIIVGIVIIINASFLSLSAQVVAISKQNKINNYTPATQERIIR